MRYYIIFNNQQYGPFEKEQLLNYGLSYESDVWAEGMPNWVKASSVEELRQLIATSSANNAEDGYYFMIINNQQSGPYAKENLLQHGLTPTTQVWKTGMQNWAPANTVEELSSLFKTTTPPPFTSPQQPTVQNPTYAPGQNYNNRPYPAGNYQHTDWMTWAIVGTVLGFLCSCIGVIFGIIAITKANKANILYAEGRIEEARTENSSAKTMTIVSLVLAALGVFVSFLYVLFDEGV